MESHPICSRFLTFSFANCWMPLAFTQNSAHFKFKSWYFIFALLWTLWNTWPAMTDSICSSFWGLLSLNLGVAAKQAGQVWHMAVTVPLQSTLDAIKNGWKWTAAGPQTGSKPDVGVKLKHWQDSDSLLPWLTDSEHANTDWLGACQYT